MLHPTLFSNPKHHLVQLGSLCHSGKLLLPGYDKFHYSLDCLYHLLLSELHLHWQPRCRTCLPNDVSLLLKKISIFSFLSFIKISSLSCAPSSNCICGTYSCSKTIGCSTGTTAPALPNTFTYGVQAYTDSKCTELYSISGGAKSGVCIQTSSNTSSQGAATCSTSSSVTMIFNTTGNCTGPVSSTITTNGITFFF